MEREYLFYVVCTRVEVIFIYMLGKVVDVSVKGTVCRAGSFEEGRCPFFYGYITTKDSILYRKKVYIITNTNLTRHHVKCQVIASVKSGGSLSAYYSLIVAPLGHVFYLPDIKNRLLKIRNKQHLRRVSCLYEKSCGAIVFKNVNYTRYFLLIKHRKNKHWGFPKGHVEMYESDEQTARREVKEETNLDVKILEGFRQLGFYRPYGVIEKKVVIFLAKVLENSSHIKVQKKEIDSYKWVTAEEVLKQLHVGNEASIFASALRWMDVQKVY